MPVEEKTMNNSYGEIDVTDKKYSVDNLVPDSENWNELWMNNLMSYRYLAEFWRSRLQLGKKCMKYAKREIFTEAQLAEYKKRDKIPVQPQEVKKHINIIAKEISNLVQASYVTTEDDTPPENAMAPEDVNVVLQWMKEQVDYDTEIGEALWDGLLTGYPQWLWFDKEEMLGEISEKMTASHLPWDSTLCSQYFQKADGSDIDEVIRLYYKTKAEMLDIYPDRKKAHEKHQTVLKESPGYYKELLQQDYKYTAENRPDILFDEINSATFNNLALQAPNGYYLVMERFFVVKKKQRIYLSEEKLDAQIMPPDWNEQRIDTWQKLNPSYDTIKNDFAKTLWVSTISSDGFIWENGKHWYQREGKLPGTCFIPSMIDKMPTGFGEDMLPYVLSIAVADTEGLDQVRAGGSNTTFIQEGALVEPDQYHKQANIANGVVLVKRRGGSIDNVVKTEKKTPNETYFAYAEKQRRELKDVNNINDSISGVTHPRQSKVSKQSEIEQGLGAQSSYVKSYSHFVLKSTQLMVDLFPYVLTEERVICIKDEYGKPKEQVVVNQEGLDPATLQSTIIANDLTTSKYRIVPIPGENTETSRKQQLTEFVQLLEAVGNTLFQLPPSIMGNILLSIPNEYTKQAGTAMMEFAQSQQESQSQSAKAEQDADMQKEKGRRMMDWFKINAPKVAIKMDGTSTAENPMGVKAMMEYIEQNTQKQAQILENQGAGEQQETPPEGQPPQPAPQQA